MNSPQTSRAEPVAEKLSTGWVMDLISSAIGDVEGAAQQAFWDWDGDMRADFAEKLQANFLNTYAALNAADEQSAAASPETVAPEPFTPEEYAEIDRFHARYDQSQPWWKRLAARFRKGGGARC